MKTLLAVLKNRTGKIWFRYLFMHGSRFTIDGFLVTAQQ